MITLKQLLTKETFSEKIEEMVLTGEFTYFEAILDFADENDADPEELLPFMTQVLLEKVRKSATDSGLINLRETDLEEFL